VKYVELDRRHTVQIALQNVERDKVAPGINHQSPPGKARAVLNRNRGHGEACARGLAPVAEKCRDRA
jgi:hypothetical protein